MVDAVPPILRAVAGNDIQAVRALLRDRPDAVLDRDVAGNCAVHVAAAQAGADDTQDAVLALLLHHAPEAAHALNHVRWTPLATAARAGNPAAVVRLLRVAPSLADAATAPGMRPVHLAFQAYESLGDQGTADTLVALLRDEAARRSTTLTALALFAGVQEHPLWRAAERGHDALVRAVCALFPDAMAEGLPIHHAASYGRPNVVRALLELDASLARATDERGNTPLHHAAGSSARALPTQRAEVARVLLEAAPELLAATNREGETALSLALATRHVEVAAALLDAPAVSARDALTALAAYIGASVCPLYVAAIRRHVPLSPDLWALVPSPLPGLVHALPDVLERGAEADVDALVARLPAREKEELRAAVRGLWRSCRTLPKRVMTHILSIGFQDMDLGPPRRGRRTHRAPTPVQPCPLSA